MPTLDEWQAMAIWVGGWIALLTLAGLVWKLVRRMWKIFDTAKRVSEQILGTPPITNPDGSVTPARPGFNERLNRIEATQQRIEANQARIDQRLTEHIERGDDGMRAANGAQQRRRR